MFWLLHLINGYCFGIWVKNFTQSLSFMTLETKPGCNVDQTFPFCHSEPDEWIARGRIMAAKLNVKKKTGSETRTSEAVLPILYLRWFENQREFQQLPSCYAWRWQVYWDQIREKTNDFNLQRTSASACSLLSTDTRHFASSPPVSTRAWHSAPAICHEHHRPLPCTAWAHSLQNHPKCWRLLNGLRLHCERRRLTGLTGSLCGMKLI